MLSEKNERKRTKSPLERHLDMGLNSPHSARQEDEEVDIEEFVPEDEFAEEDREFSVEE